MENVPVKRVPQVEEEVDRPPPPSPAQKSLKKIPIL